RLAVDADRLRGRVERDRAAFEQRTRPAARAAHERVQAREELFDVERLDEVVVGAVLEAEHLVLPARARGEDQDRAALPGFAQLLDEIHAGELGQSKVDDRDVERSLAPEVKTFLAVAGRVDREPITLEARRERFAQRR